MQESKMWGSWRSQTHGLMMTDSMRQVRRIVWTVHGQKRGEVGFHFGSVQLSYCTVSVSIKRRKNFVKVTTHYNVLNSHNITTFISHNTFLLCLVIKNKHKYVSELTIISQSVY